MDRVKFGDKYWYVLKEETGKRLLAGDYHWFYLDSYRNVGAFFKEVRRYMNVEFYDSCFSEEDKKHILIVNNKYPVEGYVTDELGFERRSYKMKQEKDRVFPLKYDDVRNLSSRELERISEVSSKTRVILLPSAIDSNQIVPAVCYYEPWNSKQTLDDCLEIGRYKYEDIRGYEYEDYTFRCISCVWVDSKANLKEW